MAKQKGFGISLGDLLVAAMGGDAKNVKQLAESKPAAKLGSNAQSANVQAPQPPPQASRQSSRSSSGGNKPTSARTITSPNNLIYNAGKRSPEEVRAEFNASHSSFNKRKGILEGVMFHLNRMSEIRNPDAATRQRLVDFQDLKREFESQLKEIKASVPGQIAPVPQRSIPEGGAKSHPQSQSLEKKRVALFGRKDQFDSASNSANPCDVIIGLDFGTACTKVVVRTPDHFGNACFLVPFGTFGHPTNEHLLPTHLTLSNNHYTLSTAGEAADYSDLKMRLIESLSSFGEDEAIDNAIAYLALVFRYVRTWFMQEKCGTYGEFQLIWQINVGIPSASAECDDLCRLYQKTVYTAWRFSLYDGEITYPGLLKVRELMHSEDSADFQELITVFPEVAAEVTGYTQSDLRQEGLHLLIDIGAGTLDVCGFNVHRSNGDNLLPLFSTSVERQGVCVLHETRRNTMEACLKSTFSQIMPEPATPLTGDNSSYIPERKQCEKALDSAETEFFRSCAAQVYGVVRQLRTSMDPRSDRWNSYLPVFLCGGGSTMPQYQAIAEGLSSWLRSNVGNCQAKLLELPYPAQLQGNIKSNEYHRFAVACGLSYRSFDIDKVIIKLKPVHPPAREGVERPWYERGPDYLHDDY